MGVVPVIIQLIVFTTAGYYFGKSDRRSFAKNILLIAFLSFAVPVIIVAWLGKFDYQGYLFIAVDFLQLTLFGVIGAMIGYFKNKRDEVKEESN